MTPGRVWATRRIRTVRFNTVDNAMRSIQLIGLILWRGGTLIIAATVLIETARWILRFWTMPLQIEIGLGLLLSGAVLSMLSLVLERIHDTRVEKEQSA